MQIAFEEFEKKVMDKLLFGNDPNLEKLRIQYSNARIETREFSGVGFFTNFSVADDAQKIVGKQNLQISDLSAELENVKNGVGFILFISDGYLKCLEGFTFDEPWPSNSMIVSFIYGENDSKTRDMEKFKMIWMV